MKTIITSAMFLIIGSAVFATEPAEKFSLRDGDRVIFIGNTFIERDRHYGRFETMLRSRFPGTKFSVRNLAWPGDTTTVQMRPLNFGTFEEHILNQKPTVVFVGYGTNEAFEGARGLESYLAGYRNILGILAKTQSRVVIVSPIRQEFIGPPFPDPRPQNQRLWQYIVATGLLAAEYPYYTADLFRSVIADADAPVAKPLTENGIHLTTEGYEKAAEALAQALKLGPSRLSAAKADKVREEIIHKDALFFNRWRAHNGEYIYGRRSKAGSGNAGNPTFVPEMAEFDRLLKIADEKIAELSK